MTDIRQAPHVGVKPPPRAPISTNGKPPLASSNGTAAIRPGTPVRMDKRDPRYLALRNFALSMSVFNILGYTVLGFEQPWTWPIFALLLGYTVELTIEMVVAWSAGRRPEFRGNGARGVYTFLLPTHITVLAVEMLLYGNTYFWPIALGIVIAISQKTILKAPINGRMRHFMNPSNFGITVVLLSFTWMNIAPPYQFTENVSDVIRLGVPLVILTAGTVLNAMLTKKVALIVGWAGGFVIQALVRHFVWDVALWAALGPMTGVAFVLFTNYMITDPGTTPSTGRAKFMFGAGTATVYGILMLFNVVYTLFFAVCVVCAIRGSYWWIRWAVARRQEAHPGIVAPPLNGAPVAA